MVVLVDDVFFGFSFSFQFQPKPKNEDHDTDEPRMNDQIKDEYVKPVEDDGKHITITPSFLLPPDQIQ
jgi:hypothetical protein